MNHRPLIESILLAPGNEAGAVSAVAPTPDDVRIELDRILGSDVFRRSPRHRQFLRCVVEHTLRGELDALKELSLGVGVFGRRVSSFDPQLDPIVRVEAGRLRDKLRRFYDGDSSASIVEIALPKGAYVPQFKARAKAAVVALRPASIAVLPFVQFGAGVADAGLGDALTEELIEALVRLPNLKVVARTSSFQFRNSTQDVRAIGRALGVSHVVEGSIQRNGARLRCIAQLVRADDGLHEWSGRFDVDDPDIFVAQDAAVRNIVDALAAWLVQRGHMDAARVATQKAALGTASLASGDARAPMPNAAARDSYNHGRYLSHQRSLDAFPKAIAHFRRAIALDPRFAPAHAALAIAELNLAGMVAGPSTPHIRTAKVAACEALAIDPELGDALAVMAALLYRFEFDWPAALPIYRRALQVAPGSVYVQSSYAWALMCRGEFDEASRHASRAMEMDPLNLGLRSTYAQFLSYWRAYDAAEEELLALLEIDPHHAFSRVVLGFNYLYWGKPLRATDQFRQVMALVPGHPTAYLGAVCALAQGGATGEARAELGRVIAQFAGAHCSPVHIAAAYAGLGDTAAMYDALERAVAERDFLVCTLPVDPLFDRYHGDQRLQALLSRNRLAPATRVRGSVNDNDVQQGAN